LLDAIPLFLGGGMIRRVRLDGFRPPICRRSLKRAPADRAPSGSVPPSITSIKSVSTPSTQRIAAHARMKCRRARRWVRFLGPSRRRRPAS
jgi:hypothetical protein